MTAVAPRRVRRTAAALACVLAGSGVAACGTEAPAPVRAGTAPATPTVAEVRPFVAAFRDAVRAAPAALAACERTRETSRGADACVERSLRLEAAMRATGDVVVVAVDRLPADVRAPCRRRLDALRGTVRRLQEAAEAHARTARELRDLALLGERIERSPYEGHRPLGEAANGGLGVEIGEVRAACWDGEGG